MFSDARTKHVFPPAITGINTETSPNNEVFWGAKIPTTPVGSYTEKLKCDEETGFTALSTWLYLSHQPA